MQTDPIGYADGINWYAYCRNNPVTFVDSLGLKTSMIFVGKDGGKRLGGFTKRALKYQISAVKNEKGYNPVKDKIVIIGDDEDLTPSSMKDALNNHTEIQRLIYVGHGGANGLYLDDVGKGPDTNLLSHYYSGDKYKGGKVSDFPTHNVEPDASIYLFSCRASKTSSSRPQASVAHSFAYHFAVPVYATDFGVSFGRFGFGGRPRSVDKGKTQKGEHFRWILK